tara:strand:+ start:115134 stop:115883 length:750 start_codon:yes stop_codon:yes gene_type:complete
MTQLTSIRAGFASYPVRLTLFGICTFALFAVIFFATTIYPPEWLSAENGPLELLQVALIGCASVTLFFAAFKSTRGRAALTIMASLAGYASARETDSLFESLLFDDAYKYFAALPLMLVCVSAVWRDRSNLRRDFAWVMNQRCTTIFAIGGTYLFCICQILDSPAFWGGPNESDWAQSGQHAHAVKQMVEEFCEVFAYVLIGFAGVEAAASVLQNSHIESASEDDSSEADDSRSTIRIASFPNRRRRAA